MIFEFSALRRSISAPSEARRLSAFASWVELRVATDLDLFIEQLLQAFSNQLYLALRGGLGFLHERVEDQNSMRRPRIVKNVIAAGTSANAKFRDSVPI